MTGLSLEQLGFEPRLEDLTEDQRNQLGADDLGWPEQRDQSLFQAKLLAGALWEASAVLIDQLFEDLNGLLKLDEIDRHEGAFELDEGTRSMLCTTTVSPSRVKRSSSVSSGLEVSLTEALSMKARSRTWPSATDSVQP